MAVVLLCNLAVHNAAGLVCNVFWFGLFSGAFIALPPVLFVQLTADKSKVGTRIGMGFAIMSCGVLVGGPGAGGILERNGQDPSRLDWTGTWILGGVCPLAAGVAFVVLRMWRSGPKLMVKV